MTEAIFGFLESVGFVHPLHPAATHIPMGMVMGCFFFGIVAWLFKKQTLRTTAFHCSVLALIFAIPTILTGLLDWQYRWGGEFNPLIILKMVLAGVLLVLLSLSIWMYKQNMDGKKLFFVYVLCLACVTGLGFSGGELVYGG